MTILRLGILGGTFDPPHYGHLALAQNALVQLQLERVLFIPAGQQPPAVLMAVPAGQQVPSGCSVWPGSQVVGGSVLLGGGSVLSSPQAGSRIAARMQAGPRARGSIAPV